MKNNRISSIILGFIAIISLSACMENYGTMIRSTEVSDIFEISQVLPDHTYYYSGSQARPDAIIGIKNTYQLVNSFWHQVPENKLQEQISDWHRMLGSYNDPGTENYYYGSYMYGPDKEVIGIWYAYTDYGTIKKIDENQYNIYTPTPSNMSNQINRRSLLSR